MSALERMAAHVRKSMPEVSDATQARQRVRFVNAVPSQHRTRRIARVVAIALLTATSVGAGGLAMKVFRGATSAPVAAPAPSNERWWPHVEQHTVELVADRGELQLEVSSTAHLAQSGSNVEVVLERGEAVSHVVPKRGTRWRVRAGAYLVQAVGTRFSVRYDPSMSELSVRVDEGSVQVTGGQLGVSSVQLEVGEVLSVVGTRVAIERQGGASDAAIAARQPAIDSAPSSSALSELKPAPAQSVSGAVKAPSWLELQAAGDYRGALELAKQLGFDQLVVTSTCSELTELADVARLARDSTRAQQALLALRGRCLSSAGGLRAAFLLGRLLDDANPAQAASWYEKYLSEAAGDRFADQALGRLISAEQRAGQSGRAKAAAARYIRLYPNGSYAELARSLGEP